MYSLHSTATNGEAGDSGTEDLVFRSDSGAARGQEEKGGDGNEHGSLFEFTRTTPAVVKVKTVGTDRVGVGSVGSSHEGESELRMRAGQQ